VIRSDEPCTYNDFRALTSAFCACWQFQTKSAEGAGEPVRALNQQLCLLALPLVVNTAPKAKAFTRPACAAPGCAAWLREDRDEKNYFVCWADDDVANCCHTSNWLERIHMVGVGVEDARDGKHHLITIKEEVAVKLWPWLTVKHIKAVMNDPRAWERLCGKLAGTKITARLHIAYHKQNKLSVTVFLPDEEATVSDSD